MLKESIQRKIWSRVENKILTRCYRKGVNGFIFVDKLMLNVDGIGYLSGHKPLLVYIPKHIVKLISAS
jgi:hypothetical protein